MTTIINGSSPSITFSDSTTQSTALPNPSTAGNVLVSNGTIWESTAFSAGFSGGAITSSAVDITLTSSSAQAQQITMTAANKKVTLPDATTMSKGAIAFYIANAGGISFDVVDSSGGNITTLTPYDSVSLVLVNNSTAAGVWLSVTSWEKFAIVAQDTTNVLSGGSVTVSACMISDTAGVVSYRSSSDYAYLRAFTFNASTKAFTWGTAVQVDASGSTSQLPISIFRLTDTTFFFGYYTTGSPAAIKGVIGTLSGASITLGSLGTFATLSGVVFNTGAQFVKVDATTIVAVWDTYNGPTTYNTAAATISGTTLSAGNTTTRSGTGNEYFSPNMPLMVLGTTLVLVSSYGGNGDRALAWTVTGNTSSAFTESTGFGYSESGGFPVKASSTSFWVGYKAANLPVLTYTVSGTTVTQTQTSTSVTGSTNAPVGYVENTYITSASSIVLPYDNNGLVFNELQRLNKAIKGNTPFYTDAQIVESSSGYVAFATSTDSFSSAYILICKVL